MATAKISQVTPLRAITSGDLIETETAGGVSGHSALGTMAGQSAGAVAITGGSVTGITDLAVADGGTGASDAAGARTNLGALPVANLKVDFGAIGDGLEDDSEAWAEFIDFCSNNRVMGFIPAGTYYIGSAPGTVVDPDVHDCPEVHNEFIWIEGEGADLVTLRCATGPITGSATTVSRALLKAVAPGAGGVFRLKGITLDGGVSALDGTLDTGIFAQAQTLLEVRGYDHIDIDVSLTRFAMHRDDRSEPLSVNYDPALFDTISYGRRGPMLIADGGETCRVRYILETPTFREGPFIAATLKNRDIVFSHIGGGDTVGTVSSVCNAFGGAAADVTTKVYWERVEAKWRGSFLNLGWVGDAVIGGCPVAGENGTVTAGSETSISETNWGPGIDCGGEINPSPSKSLHLDNVILLNNHRYSAYMARDASNPIGRVTGRITVTGGWWGPRIEHCTHVDLDAVVDGPVDYTGGDVNYGNGATVVAVESGRLNLTARGIRTAENSIGATLRSNAGLRIHQCGSGLRVSGRIEDFYNRLLWSDIETADDGLYSLSLSTLNFVTSVYTASGYGQPLITIGETGAKRLQNAYVNDVMINGTPLCASSDVVIHVAGTIAGIDTLTLGNPADTLAIGDVLFRLQAYSGDNSSSQRGIRGRLEARANDINGRGADWTVSTSYQAGAVTDRFSVKGEGHVHLVPLAATVGGAAGDLAYVNASGTFGAFNAYAVDPLGAGAWGEVPVTVAGTLVIHHGMSTGLAQGADLGGIGFWNNDGSHTTVGVKARFGALANDANGRGADAIIQTTDGNGSMAAAAQFFGNKAFKTFGGRIKLPRIVTAAGAVTVTTADHVVVVRKTSGAATVVNLPDAPATGTEFVVKDGKGDAAINNITITPAAGTIDGSATYVMATNHQSVKVIYDGSEWVII